MSESDVVMLPDMKDVIGRMPIVTELVSHLKEDGFSFDRNVLVFGVQHLMAQSLALCWALNELGLSYDRITLAGKPYSTNLCASEALRRLGVSTNGSRQYRLACSQAEEQIADLNALVSTFGRQKDASADPVILVLDDGGHALTHLDWFASEPYRAVGVEQTASGFWQKGVKSVPFPIVDVGASAVKRLCEPKLIVDAALSRATSHLDKQSLGRRCGIVGLGYIGSALASGLAAAGLDIVVYDINQSSGRKLPGRRADSMHQLFDESDIIFGCAGSDITTELNKECATRGLRPAARTLVSMSSGDDEFFDLKQLLVSSGKMDGHTYTLDKIPDIRGQMWGSEFVILRNGFPINFDNSDQSVGLDQIQGTIAALVGASCQAYTYAKSRKSKLIGTARVMLDVQLQRWLFSRWVPWIDGSIATAKMPSERHIVEVSSHRAEPPSVNMGDHFGGWVVKQG